MSSDEDDELPPILDIQYGFGITTDKPSVDDLFERSCRLIHELDIEKQVQEDAEALSPSPDFNIIEPERDSLEDEETEQKNNFLKRPDHLQYFSQNDITLKNCGYSYKTEMSTDEEIMFALEPHELFELIRTDNVCRNILNVNALVHFLIKSMSLHSDAAVISSSQILIRSLVADSEDICLTYEDIFQILFNCSADVSTSEIFEILKPRLVSPSCTSSEPIPEYWLLNLKAVLCTLNDILKVCRIPEEDLAHIAMSFLIMSVEREYVIHLELQNCLITVLDRFFSESWPIYRLTIANSLGSLPSTNFLNGQWLYVYEMVKAIPIVSLTGDQLRKYICVRILLNLTDYDHNQSTEYSEELFSLSALVVILNSLDTNDKNFQHVIIKFLDILVNHLKFTIEEYEQLCKQLKMAQKNFEMSSNLLDLELIHARINLSNLNIKILKPLKYKHIQLKYAESDDAMSDDEILPNVEDAHDIPTEMENSGMLSVSNIAQKSGGFSETMRGNSDDPKNQFRFDKETCSAFVNETEKMVENCPDMEYLETYSVSTFTQKDNKVSEQTETDSEKPNCLVGASKEATGELINGTDNLTELKTLCQGPNCEEIGNHTSGQRSFLKIGDENVQMVTTMTELSNTKGSISAVSSKGFDCLDSGSQMDTSNEAIPKISDYFSAPKLIWNEHSYSNAPKKILTEGIDFPLENRTLIPNVVDLKTDNQHSDPAVPDSEFEISLTENGSLKVIHKSTLKTMIIPTSDLEPYCANILNNQNSAEFKISMTESGSLKIMDTSSLKTITITTSDLETYCVDMLKTRNAVEIQSKNMPVEKVCKTENNLEESSIQMDKETNSGSLSKETSLNNYFFESIVEIETEDPLAKEPMVPQISNQCNLLLSLKSNEDFNNLNFKESNKLETAISENPQVSNNKQLTSSFQILEEMEGLSSKEIKAVKEEVSEAGSLLIPEICASTSKALKNNNLTDSSLPSVKWPNQDSSSKESSSNKMLSTDEFSIEAPPAIIQSNLNIPKHLVESNLPVYSTDICKQIRFPSTLVEEIPEIVPVIQSAENFLQLPLNEQCGKAPDNSALPITLPVYSTSICNQILHLASLVEEIPEIVPVIPSAENFLQGEQCEKTSDNSLYETLDEQFRNTTASPMSLLNSLNEIYCKSKKIPLSSSLSNDETSNPPNLDIYTSQTSTSSMPDIVLSSLGTLSSPKRKLSASEPASPKRLKTEAIVNLSQESIAGKENDNTNAAPTNVKDYDSSQIHRYAALSSFATPTGKRTPTKNPKITEYFQGSSRTVKSKSRTNNCGPLVIQVDSDSEDDCQVVDVKKGDPQLVFLD